LSGFLNCLKIEMHPAADSSGTWKDRTMRVHTWVKTSQDVHDYWWFDTGNEDLETMVWSCDIETSCGDDPMLRTSWQALWTLKLSLVHRVESRKRPFWALAFWVDHYRGIGPPKPVPSEDILFEVPLDAERLGEHPGQLWEENRVICRTDLAKSDDLLFDEFVASHPLTQAMPIGGYSEVGGCQSGRGEQFEWEWGLTRWHAGEPE